MEKVLKCLTASYPSVTMINFILISYCICHFSNADDKELHLELHGIRIHQSPKIFGSPFSYQYK